MKRIVLILILVLCLICSCSKKDNDNVIDTMESNNTIQYKTGVYDDKDWSDTVGTYYGDVVPNETVALNIAKAIFEGIEKNQSTSSFTPQLVFYDEEEKVWIVSFWNNEAVSNGIIGYDCSIAINKSDGRVLRIWYGE